MRCEELLAYLSDYIDNEISGDLTAAAQAHLATCENCRVVLNTTQKAIFLVHTYGTRTIPAQRRQNLWNQLEDALARKKASGELDGEA